MTTTYAVQHASRLVRMTVLGATIALVPALTLVHQAVGGSSVADAGRALHCGATTCDQESSPAVAALVDELSGQGLSCGPTPHLTDVVVVEWFTGGAEVVDLDRALSVAADREGRLRSFCVPSAPAR